MKISLCLAGICFWRHQKWLRSKFWHGHVPSTSAGDPVVLKLHRDSECTQWNSQPCKCPVHAQTTPLRLISLQNVATTVFPFELLPLQIFPTCLMPGGCTKKWENQAQREKGGALHWRTRQTCGTKKESEGSNLTSYLDLRAARCLPNCICDYLTQIAWTIMRINDWKFSGDLRKCGLSGVRSTDMLLVISRRVDGELASTQRHLELVPI